MHVQKVANAVGHMHALTRCDTVSAFDGKGKIGALKLVQQNKKYQDAFIQLGEGWSVSDSLFAVLEEFTCCLYARTSAITAVNDLRFRLFRAKKGDIESGQLPPCKDCLLTHTRHANYQSRVWHLSLEQCQSLPSPAGHGWCMEEGKIANCWMNGSPAQEMEFLSCKCSRVCKIPTYTCLTNRLK